MIKTQNITLAVDENTALLFERADDNKRKSINFLLFEWLKSENYDSLSFLMDKMGFSANSNGFNEDLLSEILSES